MAEQFDPYRKWLGIPVQDQPPHHYRLLGLELFEADADVISNAVDGRMALIKTFQSGKYSEHSQRILNEIAAARVCLLNPAKKAEYDRQLREHGAAETASPVGAAAAFPAKSDLYVSYSKKKPSNPIVPLIGGLAAMIAIAVAILVYLANHKPPEIADSNSQNQTQKTPSKKDDAVKHKKADSPSKIPPKNPKVVPPKKTDTSAGSVTEPKKPEPVQLPQPDIEKPVKPIAEPKPPKEEPKEEPKEPEAKKLPIPNESQQHKAEAKIREIYGDDLMKAKTAEKKAALALEFLKHGEDKSNDFVMQFAFLRMARDMAENACESKRTVGAVDVIAEKFDLGKDPAGLQMKIESLTKLYDANRTKPVMAEKTAEFFVVVKDLMETAADANDYDAAQRICRLGIRAAATTRDPVLNEFKTRQAELKRAGDQYTAVHRAIEALAKKPEDPAANYTVGRWQCLTKDQWPKGLPLLAKGDNAAWAKAAKQELSAPSKPLEQVSLADVWCKLAEKEPSASKIAMQQHAIEWYEKAMPNLKGIDKTQAEKRLKAIESSVTSGGVRGVVEKGNVALASNGTVVEGRIANPEQLLDGNSARYDKSTGYAYAKWPFEWTITLPKTYQIREIRMLFWDKEPRSYQYAISTSSDGKNFVPLVDRSKGSWKSWQTISFSARAVKAIKFYGIHADNNPHMSIVEIEAYCIPPK